MARPFSRVTVFAIVLSGLSLGGGLAFGAALSLPPAAYPKITALQQREAAVQALLASPPSAAGEVASWESLLRAAEVNQQRAVGSLNAALTPPAPPGQGSGPPPVGKGRVVFDWSSRAQGENTSFYSPKFLITFTGVNYWTVAWEFRCPQTAQPSNGSNVWTFGSNNSGPFGANDGGIHPTGSGTDSVTNTGNWTGTSQMYWGVVSAAGCSWDIRLVAYTPTVFVAGPGPTVFDWSSRAQGENRSFYSPKFLITFTGVNYWTVAWAFRCPQTAQPSNGSNVWTFGSNNSGPFGANDGGIHPTGSGTDSVTNTGNWTGTSQMYWGVVSAAGCSWDIRLVAHRH